MFNPELKEVYSPVVEKELIKLANYFEQKDEVAYVSGIANNYGILTTPESISVEKVNKVDGNIVGECMFNYLDTINMEDTEKVCVLTYLSVAAIKSINPDEELIRLWVK